MVIKNDNDPGLLNSSRSTGLKFPIWAHHRIRPGNRANPVTNTIHLILKMNFAKVIETSVINSRSFQNYPHLDDHTIRTIDTPGLKPFTILIVLCYKELKRKRHEAHRKDDGHTFMLCSIVKTRYSLTSIT